MSDKPNNPQHLTIPGGLEWGEEPKPTLLADALDHIRRTCKNSRTQTRRLRWIEKRAELALAGRPYVEEEHTMPVDAPTEYLKMRRQAQSLREDRNHLRTLLLRVVKAGVLSYEGTPTDEILALEGDICAVFADIPVHSPSMESTPPPCISLDLKWSESEIQEFKDLDVSGFELNIIPTYRPAPVAKFKGPYEIGVVGILRSDGDGGLVPDWTLEGGTAELWEGALLLVSTENLTDEEGGGQVYRSFECTNCEDNGVVGYTRGQTAETFEQGEYPCPECRGKSDD